MDHAQNILNNKNDKKATINPQNSDVKDLQYVVTVPLNLKYTGKILQRIAKIRPFIDQ